MPPQLDGERTEHRVHPGRGSIQNLIDLLKEHEGKRNKIVGFNCQAFPVSFLAAALRVVKLSYYVCPSICGFVIE